MFTFGLSVAFEFDRTEQHLSEIQEIFSHLLLGGVVGQTQDDQVNGVVVDPAAAQDLGVRGGGARVVRLPLRRLGFLSFFYPNRFLTLSELAEKFQQAGKIPASTYF